MVCWSAASGDSAYVLMCVVVVRTVEPVVRWVVWFWTEAVSSCGNYDCYALDRLGAGVSVEGSCSGFPAPCYELVDDLWGYASVGYSYLGTASCE